jgi:hypothetical protein
MRLHEEVYAVKAGRELDALVAEKVMGWEPVNDPDTGLWWRVPKGGYNPSGFQSEDAPPAYSTDIAAAWQVVEKITRPLANIRNGEWCLDRLGYRCCEHDEDGVHGEWRCSFRAYKGEDDEWVHVTASTAPLAICLAALKACGVEVPA